MRGLCAFHSPSHLSSGKKEEPKPKLLGLDIFGWGGGLPRQAVGAKRFGMSFKTQKTKLFVGISRDFCWDIPGVPEKAEKKEVCVQFSGAGMSGRLGHRTMEMNG